MIDLERCGIAISWKPFRIFSRAEKPPIERRRKEKPLDDHRRDQWRYSSPVNDLDVFSLLLDTGSAAIYGLRNKKDVSVFIMFPQGRVSPVQEAQMTTVLDANVHCLAVDGTFDDCQDILKALFADEGMKKTQRVTTVNSINWARCLAQITYYFYAYFSLLRQSDCTDVDEIRVAVPTGNFGSVLAGYFAKKMGLPVSKLIVSTNENDILHRFWETGKYEKQYSDQHASNGIPADGAQAHPEGVRETMSPAMDIISSSNFERLLWILVYETLSGASISTPSLNATTIEARSQASQKVRAWYASLKTHGSFDVGPDILALAKQDFQSDRVSDEETLSTIQLFYKFSSPAYILDPHSAVGVTASLRARTAPPTPPSFSTHGKTYTIALATAHPAKFMNAVNLALIKEAGYTFDTILPKEFIGLEEKPRRVRIVSKNQGLGGIRDVILDEVRKEGVEV
jgi:threonine synthase